MRMVNGLSWVYDAKDMWQCDHLPSVDSTQREAVRRLSGSSDARAPVEPFALWTTQQTAGQGRNGRPWIDCGASLAITFAWPDIAQQGALEAWPLRVSLVAVETLHSLGPLPPAGQPHWAASLGLKWPNDLMAGGAKLGGVLVSRQRFQNHWWLLAGLGLNLQWQRTAPADRQVTDLAQLGLNRLDATHLVDLLLAAMAREVATVSSRPQEELVARFAAYDCHANQPVTIHHSGSGRVAHQGIARGITPTGELRIEEGQQMVTVSMGELSLRVASIDHA
jgi:BirA family transcriptional regulator, biotin operon repressor / biotin---[acetyl-CoA-carboxylase] ligase